MSSLPSAGVVSSAGLQPIAPAAPTIHHPLGIQYSPTKSTFAVVAEADAVRLRLVHPGTREVRVTALSRNAQETTTPTGAGVWTVELAGDWLHWCYSYELDRAGKTMVEIVDPWASLIRWGVGVVCHDTTAVTPRPALNPSDAIIYELHIRDFTHDRESGVKPQWQGKYLGLAQSGTKIDGTSITTGLDHLVELGVNTVQIMPVHAFAMPYDPDYEWGYMPLYFNAPHEGYASSVEVDAPVREFKRLVSALHEQGLRVTLDVVYNHTAERWPDRLRSLMALAPREYFRFKDDGSVWNGSLCGNEFRSESYYGRRFIIESTKRWVTEYGVDGFRFDLMGLIDQETMTILARELHAIDPTILVYGEPWAAGPTPIQITNKGQQKSRGFGVFNDDIRDGLRGEVFIPEEKGFLATGTNVHRVKIGILGGVGSGRTETRVAAPVAGFADVPTECINYIECHDNHTLHDRLEISLKGDPTITPEIRERMARLGILALMTSQGVPFIHAGQEFSRSKFGHDNTYNLGDHVNNIPWTAKECYAHLYAFTREMIRMRRQHPMFRLRTATDVQRAVRFLDSDFGLKIPAGTIAYQVTDVTGTDSWSDALVLLNGSRLPASFPLPDGSWRVFTTDGRLERRRDDTTKAMIVGTLDLQPHCGAVLYHERTS